MGGHTWLAVSREAKPNEHDGDPEAHGLVRRRGVRSQAAAPEPWGSAMSPMTFSASPALRRGSSSLTPAPRPGGTTALPEVPDTADPRRKCPNSWWEPRAPVNRLFDKLYLFTSSLALRIPLIRNHNRGQQTILFELPTRKHTEHRLPTLIHSFKISSLS